VVDGPDIGRAVVAAAGGDAAAWHRLVERFSPLVWSITRAFRLANDDAADAFQTAWLLLAEHIDKINNPDRIGAWLATATRRECLKSIRVSRRTIPTDDLALLEGTPLDDDPTGEAVVRAERERENAEQSAAAWQAAERLPEACRRLLRVLMASPPPSYAEVAAALDLPLGSIGPTRARCLERLRQELAGGLTGRSAHS
jgi:RNA polymerase sigma factor (sigma-70 family)